MLKHKDNLDKQTTNAYHDAYRTQVWVAPPMEWEQSYGTKYTNWRHKLSILPCFM